MYCSQLRNVRLQGKLTALETSAALSAQPFEFIFHVEEAGPAFSGTVNAYVVPDLIAQKPITATCACANFMLLAQRDGAASTLIQKYSLPGVQQMGAMKVDCVVQRMWLNCDASRLAIVDAQVRASTR